jgi:DNA-binding MarR family transcriptional regulator
MRRIRYFTDEIRNTASCLRANEAILCEELGLSAAQWGALAAIRESPFVLSISALARRLRLARQSAHSLVLGLERAGWIRLFPNPDDRRLIQMEMTAAGNLMLGTAATRWERWLLVMTADLAEQDLGKLILTLKGIRARISRTREYL